MTRLGRYRYIGNGTALEHGVEYTVYDTGDGYIEVYPENEPNPIRMDRWIFIFMANRNFESISDPFDPMLRLKPKL